MAPPLNKVYAPNNLKTLTLPLTPIRGFARFSTARGGYNFLLLSIQVPRTAKTARAIRNTWHSDQRGSASLLWIPNKFQMNSMFLLFFCGAMVHTCLILFLRSSSVLLCQVDRLSSINEKFGVCPKSASGRLCVIGDSCETRHELLT